MKAPPDMIQEAWQRAIPDAELDPTIWRKDTLGAWIISFLYGDRTSPFGWEADEANPSGKPNRAKSKRLQPMQWENWLILRSDHPHCVVTSRGLCNVHVGT